MTDKNVVLLTWADSGSAYEAFSKFKELDTGIDTVYGSAVVSRDENGQLQIKDGQDNDAGISTLGGGALGALLGLIGGPLGLLFGFTGGALIGGTFDIANADDKDDVLAAFSQALPPGRTGIVAEVAETDPAVIDDFAAQTGAELLRKPEDEVLDELAAAEDAADAAADAARQATRDAKKEQRHEDRQARVDKLKAKFSHNDS